MLTLAEDELGRADFINKLFALFENFGDQGNRGFTMILNGRYGSGKTTLLGFISERNAQERKFDIVDYNAWQNNLFDNPLIPILYEISKLKKKNETLGDKVKEKALKVLKSIPKILLGTFANAHSIDLTPLVEETTDIFKEYDDYRKSIEDFREILTEYCKDHKVLFIVDELDRCLPEYQIKVLEVLYHLFEIPNLIVIIALDKQQLERSIKDKFGEEQNTLGYLSKFINYQVDLPDDNKETFVQSLMRFECDGSGYETSLAKQFIAKLFDLMGYSVRDCQRIVDELNLICNQKTNMGMSALYHYWYPALIATILIAKHSNEKIYKKWFYKEREDYYSTDTIPYKESRVNNFFADVLKTNLEPIFNYIKNPQHQDGFAEYFLRDFINAFCPVQYIDSNELVKELKIDINVLKSNNSGGMRYPFNINEAIKKVRMLSL